ncbi:MAG: site-specific DNA-methyltransferase [Bacteroidetes bacterium]|nr:site-specific DNA-methyltransferase [Bacteroidota bacterium]
MKLQNRSDLNKTIHLTKKEISFFSGALIKLHESPTLKEILNKTVNQDLFKAIEFLPAKFVDLLIIDPPYNLSKAFNKFTFREKSIQEYSEWIESFIVKLKRTLKPTASIYFCGDWHTSISIPAVLEKHFVLRNRITWEREKGRGATQNWKNSSEDIWFCTVSNKFTFNPDEVKLMRRVLAPYRDEDNKPKDWHSNHHGEYRLTFPSNFWNDISVPFWSMPENTEHPTQKPEKLIAKLILASSKKGDVVLDPFLGSGTTSVVAKKLERKYLGIEMDKYYACLAEKRLALAGTDTRIQGYDYKTFWERNTKPFSADADK